MSAVVAKQRFFSLNARLPWGALLFFGSTTLVNAGNYVYNLLLGRWLGPAAFADVTIIVTLMLVCSVVPAVLTQTAAHIVAVAAASDDVARATYVRRVLRRWAWALGSALLLLCVGGAPLLQRFFHTASPWPFVVLGLGLPLLCVGGVERGVLQGYTRFGRLALSLQAEMWVRLLTAIALVALGWHVVGAIMALPLSFAAAWLVARPSRTQSAAYLDRETKIQTQIAMRRFVGPVALALAAQIVINNSDVLLVKHFFAPADAGQYAALALVGRIVFFATWSVAVCLLPLVTQRHARGEPHRPLLYGALAIVLAISLALIVPLLLLPVPIVDLLFGPAYRGIAPLLWLYASVTTLYALANVLITYHLSLGDGRSSAFALLAGLLQIIGVSMVHQTLWHVVMIQGVIMGALLALLVARDARQMIAQRHITIAAVRGH